MSTEEKQILLQDISARLPYGVKLLYNSDSIAQIKDRVEILRGITIGYTIWYETNYGHYEYESTSGSYDHFKPYLRPLSSMTEEEMGELRKILCLDFAPKDCPQFEPDFSVRTFYSCNEQEQDEYYDMETMLSYFKFLNSHHFDYRGLIGMGLALEAPEGMYNFK